MHNFRQLLKHLWAAPTSAAGLPFLLPIPFCDRVSAARVDGVLELHGGIVTKFLRHATPLPGGARAMTFGHVVLGFDPGALHATREHERVHVRQAERWGPFFIPAYLLASLCAWARGDDPYRGNRFEREAFEASRPSL